MTRRIDRVNVLLRQEISRQLTDELKDPRISSIVSVIHVDTSPDLSQAKVYISVLGNATEKASTLIALKSASGFIQRKMRNNVYLKKLPVLNFYLDDSIERGVEVLEILDNNARRSNLPPF